MPIPLRCFFFCPPLPPSHLTVLWPTVATGEGQKIRINHIQALCPQPQLLYHSYWHEPRRLPGTCPPQGACFKRAQQVSQAPAYLRHDLISRSRSLPGFPDTLTSNSEREGSPEESPHPANEIRPEQEGITEQVQEGSVTTSQMSSSSPSKGAYGTMVSQTGWHKLLMVAWEPEEGQ